MKNIVFKYKTPSFLLLFLIITLKSLFFAQTLPSDDYDGDGIINSVDIDDDNDGILDINEQTAIPCSSTICNSWVMPPATAGTTAPATIMVDGEAITYTITNPTYTQQPNTGWTTLQCGLGTLTGIPYWQYANTVGQTITFNFSKPVTGFEFVLSAIESPEEVLVTTNNTSGQQTICAGCTKSTVYTVNSQSNRVVGDGSNAEVFRVSGATYTSVSVTVNVVGGNFYMTYGLCGLRSVVDPAYADIDTDGDGIPNRLDLDSDGDGCYDKYEAGVTGVTTNGTYSDSLTIVHNTAGDAGTNGLSNAVERTPDSGIPNYSSTYSPIALNNTLKKCFDTDADGINDISDIDDDNDGVTDAVESPSCFYTLSELKSQTYIATDLSWDAPNPFSSAIDGDVTTDGDIAAGSLVNRDLARFTFPLSNPLPISTVTVQLGALVIPGSSVELEGWNGASWEALSVAQPMTTANTTYTFTNTIYPSKLYNKFRLRGLAGYITGNTRIYEINFTFGQTYNSSLQPKATCVSDTDGDSIPNYLDLDSDGDGCSDLAESSVSPATDISTPSSANNAYGTSWGIAAGKLAGSQLNPLATDVNNDGLNDSVDSDKDGISNYTSTYNNYAIYAFLNTCADSDGDGTPDLTDIDDDNDGIIDAIEAPSCYYTQAEATTSTATSQLASASSGYSPSYTTDKNVATSNAFVASTNWVGLELYRLTPAIPIAISNMQLDLTGWPISNNTSSTFRMEGSTDGSSWTALSGNVYSIASSGTFTITNTQSTPLKYAYYRLFGIAGTSNNAGVTEIRLTPYNYVVSLNPKPTCMVDTDGDGITNNLDLDSDGDGCSDLTESGVSPSTDVSTPASTTNNNGTSYGIASNKLTGSQLNPLAADTNNDGLNDSVDSDKDGITNYTSTYNNYAISSSINACADSDGDGINDVADIDDDNDGILDTMECATFTKSIPNGTFDTDASGWTITPANGRVSGGRYIMDADADFTTELSQNIGQTFSGDQITVSLSLGTLSTSSTFQTQDGFKIYIGNQLIGTAPGNIGAMTTFTFSGTLIASTSSTLLRIVATHVNSLGNNDLYVDTVQLPSYSSQGCTLDTDGDGIPNRLDLDSDGDGCSDLTESGVSPSMDVSTPASTTNNNGTSYGIAAGKLAGSQLNPLAADTNNDGLNDSVDSDKDGIPNYSSTYTSYAISSSLIFCADSDGDGTPDLTDIDDDNDGIVDATESPSCFYTSSEWNTLAKPSYGVNITSALTSTTSNFSQLLDGVSGTTAVTFSASPTQAISNANVYLFTFAQAVRLDALYLQFNTATQFGGTTKIQGSNTNNGIDWLDLSAAISQTPATNVTANGSVSVTNSIKYPVTGNASTAFKYIRITGAAASNILAQNASEVYFDFTASAYVASMYPKSSCTVDTDGDGIVNHLDLDSDGDGCSDLTESGVSPSTDVSTPASTTNNNGTSYGIAAGKLAGSQLNPLAADTNNDGLNDSVDSNKDGIPDYVSTYTNYALNSSFNACLDSDGDGIGDLVDIDDDNDGILDTTEGLSCVSYNYSTFACPNTANYKWTNFTNFTTSSASGTITLASGQVINVGITSSVANMYNYDFGGSNFVTTTEYCPYSGQNGTSTTHGAGINNGANTVYTVTFSSPVVAPIFQIWSAGANGTPVTYTFNTPTKIIKSNGNLTNPIAGNSYVIQGSEGDGSILINGTVSSFTFTTSAYENTSTLQVMAGYSATTASNSSTSFSCVSRDTDGDGTPDYLDLDSDGDGCSDLTESGVSPSTDVSTPASTTNNNGASYGIASNKLTGSQLNPLAADTNNDGLNDSVDSDLDGIPNYNSTYTNYAISNNIAICADTDGDGINDIVDIDDDNDGILDATESPNCFYNVSDLSNPSYNIASDLTWGVSNPFSFAFDGNTSTWGEIAAGPIAGMDLIRFNSPITTPVKISSVTVQLGINNAFPGSSVDLEGWNGTSWEALSAAQPMNTANITYTFTNTLFPSKLYSKFRIHGLTGTITNGTRVQEINFTFGQTISPSQMPKATCTVDTDGDGIVNHLDLDSDGDGCSDLTESGVSPSTDVSTPASTTNNNGTSYGIASNKLTGSQLNPLAADTNNDGLNDSVDSGKDGIPDYTSTYKAYAISSSINACIDSDGDGINDVADIDDDNDGILDTTEKSCQPSLMDLTTLTFNGSSVASVTANSITSNNPGSWTSSYSDQKLILPIHLEFKTSVAAINGMFGLHPVTGGQAQTVGNYNDGGNKFYFYSGNNNAYYYFNNSEWAGNAAEVSDELYEIDISAAGAFTAKKGGATIYSNTAPIANYELVLTSNDARTYTNVKLTDATNSAPTCSDIDTDGDGVPNRLDLDSDGDGCSDLTESGVSPSMDVSTPASTTNNNGTSYGIASNKLAGSQLNPLAADVNNDGLNDSVDSDKDGIPNYSSTYTSYAISSSLNFCADSDGDGTPDLTDIDDDNDGIVDATESPSCFYTSSEWNTLAKPSYGVNITSALTSTTSNFSQLLDGVSGTTAVTFSASPTQAISNANVYLFTFAQAVRLDALYLQFNTATQFGGTTKIQGSNTNNGIDWLDLSAAISQTPATNVTANGSVSVTNSIKYPVTGNASTAFKYIRITGAAASNILAQNASEVYFDFTASAYVASMYPKSSCTVDTDGDGIVNHLDLDSDGDGCSDLTESGVSPSTDVSTPASTTNNNGTSYGIAAGKLAGSQLNPLAADTNNDGLNDSVDSNKDGIPDYVSTYNNYAIYSSLNACIDSDGDGIPDVMDIDDDNDGILDVTESYVCSVTDNTSRSIDWDIEIEHTPANNLAYFSNKPMMVTAGPGATIVNTTPTWSLANLNNNGTLADAIAKNDYQYSTFTTGSNRIYVDSWTYYVIGATKVGILIDDDPNFGSPVILNDAVAATTAAGTVDTWTQVMASNPTYLNKNTQYYVRFYDVTTSASINHDLIGLGFKLASSGASDCGGDIDTDGDGVPNRLDLDSDGDGCSDLTESGVSPSTDVSTPASVTNNNGISYGIASNKLAGSQLNPLAADVNNDGLNDSVDSDKDGIPNYSSTYTSYAINSSLNLCTDSDGDGIGDLVDIDDDNDGVLDATEMNCSTSIVSKTGVTVSIPPTISYTYNLNGLAGLVDGVDNNTFVVRNPVGTLNNAPWLNVSFPTAQVLSYFEVGHYQSQTLFTTASTYKIQATNDTSGTWTDVTGTLTYNNNNTSTSGGLSNYNSNIANINVTANSVAYKYYRLYGINGVNGTTWATELYFKALTCTDLDTDGDGVPNRLDLDSDGDGCSDLTESGVSPSTDVSTPASTTNNNGISYGIASNKLAGSQLNPLAADTNNDGLNDSVDSDKDGIPNYTSTYNSYAISNSINACTDTDGDGVPDVIDIDDDNDGILDVIENGCQFGFYESFGSGTSTPNRADLATKGLSGSTTGYTYSGSGDIGDGSYAIANYLSASMGNWWSAIANTDPVNPGGNTLIVNGTGPTTSVYRSPNFTNWVPGKTYNISFYAMSNDLPFAQLIKPNLTLAIFDMSNNQIGTVNTGTMNTYNQWFLFSSTFVPSVSSGYFKIVSNAASGGGNDFLIDEIVMNSVDIICDTDGDGIPNSLDLDSDGDGCSDLTESGVSPSTDVSTPASTTNNNGTSYGIASNKLAGSQLNPLAADTNNDGLNDSVDSNKDGIPDYVSTYTNYALSNNIAICADSDGDGTPDFTDIDDDNDGIVDATESPSCFYTSSEWNTLAKPSYGVNITSALTSTTSNFGQLLDNVSGTTAVTFSASPSQAISNANVYLFTFAQAVRLDALYLQFNTATQFGGTTKIQGSNTNNGIDWLDLSAAISQTPATNVTANGSVSVTNSIKYPVTGNASTAFKYIRITGAVASNILAQNASEVYFDFTASAYVASMYPKSSCTVDTDGDGIVNHLDLDSDGDGCSDLTESGVSPSMDVSTPASTTNNNGTSYGIASNKLAGSQLNPLAADTNNDGLNDSVDSNKDGIPDYVSTYTNYALSNNIAICADSDGDGTPDFTDIDDDNDGIVDATESPSCFYTSSEWNTLAKPSYGVNITSALTSTTSNFGQLLDNVSGTTAVTFSASPTQAILNANVYLFTFAQAVRLDALYLQFNTATQFGGTTKIQGSNTNNGSDWLDLSAAISQTPATNVTANGSVSATNSIKYPVTGVNASTAFKYIRITGAAASNILAQNASEVYFDFTASAYVASMYPKSSCTVDTDGDGIVNHLDLDSDGDGCSDLTESGVSPSADVSTPASTTNNNGISYGIAAGKLAGSQLNPLAADTNNDGLNDSVDSNKDGIPDYVSTYNSYAIFNSINACTDTDGDGVPDVTDIDDDNDGVLDVTEMNTICNQITAIPVSAIATPALAGSSTTLTFDNSGMTGTGLSATTTGPATFNSPGDAFYFGDGATSGNIEYTLSTGASASYIALWAQESATYAGGEDPLKDFTVTVTYNNGASTFTTSTFTTVRPTGANTPNYAQKFDFGQVFQNVTKIKINVLNGWTDETTNAGSGAVKGSVWVSTQGNTVSGQYNLTLSEFRYGCFSIVDIDTDGDGVPNRLDLDSDGDGCPDATESGTAAYAGTGHTSAGTVVNSPANGGTQTGVANAIVGSGVSTDYSNNGFYNGSETDDTATAGYKGIYTYANAINNLVSSCFCYKPAITSGTVLDTQLGITSLGRAGIINSNWPMVRKGGWIALEAKTKGFVPNRLTTAQVNAIPVANLVVGMMVYNSDLDCLQINMDGTASGWKCFNTQACPQ